MRNFAFSQFSVSEYPRHRSSEEVIDQKLGCGDARRNDRWGGVRRNDRCGGGQRNDVCRTRRK